MKAAWMIVGPLVAATAAAPLESFAARFMRAMHAGMKQMDHDMAAAPMKGNVNDDFATMMTPQHRGRNRHRESGTELWQDRGTCSYRTLTSRNAAQY
jgi:hypothetical protein